MSPRALSPRTISPRALLAPALATTACLAAPPTDTGTTEATGVTLTLSLQARTSCEPCAALTDDSLSYDTPISMTLGLLSVELLKSWTDQSPVTLFQASTPTAIDLMLPQNSISMDLGELQEGEYPYVGLSLGYMVSAIQADGHLDGIDLHDGTFSMDLCLGDYSTEGGSARTQGDYTATFEYMGYDFSMDAIAQVDSFPPSDSCAIVDASESRFSVVLTSPSPVTVSHAAPQAQNLLLDIFIQDSFSWLDNPAYQSGEDVFDVTTNPTDTEFPAGFLPRAYSLALNTESCWENL